MKQLCSLLLLAGMATLPSMSQAQVYYGVATDENLYTLNLGAATASVVGSTGAFLEGLAVSSGGQLYGTDASGNLYSINKTTGATTTIGNTGLGDVEGLAFINNQLYGVNFTADPTIYTINVSNASATSLVTLNQSIGEIRAMTDLDSNDVLVRGDGPAFNDLSEVNLTTGNVTVIGQMPGSLDAAIGFGPGGNLYALDGTGDEYLINTTNGSGTLVGNTGGQFWLDMAGSPTGNVAPSSGTPEPGSLALFVGTGLVGAGVFIRRKKHI